MPVVTTLHTVLPAPTLAQRDVMRGIIDASAKVVVMAEKGRELLRNVYGMPSERIEVIPHGIPDVAFLDTHFAKSKLGFSGKPVIVGPSTLEKIHEVLQPQPYQGDGASPKMTDAELLDRLEFVQEELRRIRRILEARIGKTWESSSGTKGVCVPSLMKKLVSGQFEKPPSRGGIRSRTPFAWSRITSN